MLSFRGATLNPFRLITLIMSLLFFGPATISLTFLNRFQWVVYQFNILYKFNSISIQYKQLHGINITMLIPSPPLTLKVQRPVLASPIWRPCWNPAATGPISPCGLYVDTSGLNAWRHPPLTMDPCALVVSSTEMRHVVSDPCVCPLQTALQSLGPLPHLKDGPLGDPPGPAASSVLLLRLAVGM